MSHSRRSSLALENAHRSGGPAARPLIAITAIGDHLAEGAIAVNARRVVTYVNRIASALLGLRVDAVVGRDVLTLAKSTDRSALFERALAEVLERGTEQLLTVTDTDSPHPFNVDYCRLLPIADGGALILLGESDRRIAEQLRQSEKLAALGELVAGVAHELNNPLAGISAFAQLLLEEPLDEEQRESARLIKREADRAVSVIRDLLLFSRKTGPSTAPVDLNALVQLTMRLRAYSLRSSGVEVEMHLDPMLPRVAGDDQKLQQVILNLIVNAEYAMRRTSTKHLVLRTRRDGDTAVTEISDTGAGMSDETLQRVFEPFFTTKPAGDGTGLGLSVSYGIIEAHGGTIAVESAPGRGTTFRILLPASGALGDAPAPSA